MPYFQRKPIEASLVPVRSRAPMAGLPSRGLASVSGVSAGAPAASTRLSAAGIVERAYEVLATQQPGRGGTAAAQAGPAPGCAASAPRGRIDAHQPRAGELGEGRSARAGARQDHEQGAWPSARATASPPPADAEGALIAAAPVLSPPGPVAPGGTAQTAIPLVNEDERPARIVFMSTGLIGDDGAHIAADRISFEPRELTLPPGEDGEVIVRVIIPGQIPCGVYSGLIRASQLDHLHAVLIVQVQRS